MKDTYKNLMAERETLIRVFNESRDKGPAVTADLLIHEIGRDGAAEIVAAMIIAHGTWDQRISGSAAPTGLGPHRRLSIRRTSSGRWASTTAT